MNIEPFYSDNREYYKSLSHILYFDNEASTSTDPYSDNNYIMQNTTLFNLNYKTINLNNFFYSLFYLVVPTYIEFSNNIIDQFYDQALKDYDQFNLFKQFGYQHTYNKQDIRDWLKNKVFNPVILQFCVDYLDINIIIFKDSCMNIIYARQPTPYKSHIILLQDFDNFQPVFLENQYIFTSEDQITWIAFRKYIMSLSRQKI